MRKDFPRSQSQAGFMAIKREKEAVLHEEV